MSRAGQQLADALNEELGRRAIEGLSLHSLRAMRDAVDSFVLSVAPSRSLPASSVTSTHIVRWIEGMRAKSLAPSTLLVRYRYLSVLMRGLVAVGALRVSPMKDLRAPRARAPIIEFPDDAALERLLNPLRYQDLNGARDLAIIWLLAAAGLRRAELIGMRWSADPALSDLDLAGTRARVLGKGRRERQIPLLAGMLSVLEAYLELRTRSSHKQHSALWLGQRGPLTTSSVNAIVAARGRMAGITHLHPHALRHAWAHRMLSSGVGEGDVMVLGGWSNRAMLSRYGAYAASERAFAAVEARAAALEPWGRSVSTTTSAGRQRGGGGGGGGVGRYLRNPRRRPSR
jgi:integrase/recombinase XerD